MSTNFYWRQNVSFPIELLPKRIRPFATLVQTAITSSDYMDDAVLIHIGKRSMAGFYCYDCGTTLNKEGDRQVHYGSRGYDDPWLDNCPICHSKQGENNVQGCCSFTWTALGHRELLKALSAPKIVMALKLMGTDKLVENEYREHFAAAEFYKEAMANPIQFQSPYEFS